VRKYRVIGGRSILGNEPGTEFEAKLKRDHEARLIALGHIEIVVEKPKPKKEQAPSAEDNKE